MSDIEIGRGKRARRAYNFDDIAIVPTRRTRDPQDVSVNWTIDAYQFDIPVLAAPMDSVVSVASAKADLHAARAADAAAGRAGRVVGVAWDISGARRRQARKAHRVQGRALRGRPGRR